MSKSSSQPETAAAPEPFFSRPEVGSALTVLSGLSFLFVCMILPLVGKAGSVTVHARENYVAFAATLAASLVLAVLATLSKLQRRKLDQSPWPVFSVVLTGLTGLLLVALLLGLLRI